jgi:hypothetical protein
METKYEYKEITPKGKEFGYDYIKIKIVEGYEYNFKEFYYVSEKPVYVSHKYKTVWNKK